MEKRKFTRIPFHVEAILERNGRTIRGTVNNLSMKGMFLDTVGRLDGEEPVDITIMLSGSSAELSVRLKGRVVRKTDQGIAIEFGEMDLDSFILLKNVVIYNSSNADGIMDEYYQAIKNGRETDF